MIGFESWTLMYSLTLPAGFYNVMVFAEWLSGTGVVVGDTAATYKGNLKVTVISS
jgi:hypothetical protein